MRAVVMGYGGMGCLGFEALRRHGFEVAAVLTHSDDPREEIWWESLAGRAAASGVPVHVVADGSSPALADLVKGYEPDFIFSFYFRSLIPERVLALARRGALNLHGSLLPRYRGRAPLNWVLVNGETETGVSLHHMIARPDAGPLVDQERVPISFEDTAYTLHGKLEKAADRLLDRVLSALKAGNAKATRLDLSQGSYYGRRRPEDGRIDWSWPAIRVYNLVRALTHPYPGAFTHVSGRKLFVWWALPLDAPAGAAPGTVLKIEREGITVAAGAGALRLVTVQLEGQPELPACSLVIASGLSGGEHLGPGGERP